MSDWDESRIKRRTLRQAHNGPEIPGPTPAKKNTKRWCKGKVGRAHKPVGRWLPGWQKFECILECTVCKKQLDQWYEIQYFIAKRPKPDWVPKKP